VDSREIRTRLAKTAEDLGLPFKGSDMLYNSRLAQELGLWAQSKNRGDEFHAAVFRAYFVDSKNISDILVLVEIASSIGLPADEGNDILRTRAFKAAVDVDWALSKEKSITAVPTFVLNQHRLVGAQHYRVFEELMTVSGIKKKSC
jgi:predicted DsbA family dithiol-disulfide isomerase